MDTEPGERVKDSKGILERASYRVEGSRLTAKGRLDWPLDLTFDLCLRDLIDNSSSPELEIALSQVKRITSPYIGVIAAAAKELKQEGRHLVLLVSKDVCRSLTSAGVAEIAEIKIVEP